MDPATYISMNANTQIRKENKMDKLKELEENAATINNCRECTLKNVDCTKCPNWDIRLSSYMNQK